VNLSKSTYMCTHVRMYVRRPIRACVRNDVAMFIYTTRWLSVFHVSRTASRCTVRTRAYVIHM